MAAVRGLVLKGGVGGMRRYSTKKVRSFLPV
jgi:hypothetical protein